MDTKTKNPGLAATSNPGFINTSHEHRTTGSEEWRRVLTVFVAGRGLSCFQATRDLGGWCPATTFTNLEARRVRMKRHDEGVLRQFGAVNCKRYRLSLSSRRMAVELLGDDCVVQ